MDLKKFTSIYCLFIFGTLAIFFAQAAAQAEDLELFFTNIFNPIGRTIAGGFVGLLLAVCCILGLRLVKKVWFDAGSALSFLSKTTARHKELLEKLKAVDSSITSSQKDIQKLEKALRELIERMDDKKPLEQRKQEKHMNQAMKQIANF